MEHRELYDFLREYAEFFERIAREEPGEHSKLISEDLAELDRFLNRRQALVKQVQNWEKHREDYQKAGGFENLTFEEIVERLEGVERDRFAALFERMEQAVSQVRFLNEKSMRVVSDHLEAILRIFPEVAPAGAGEYAPAAGRPNAAPRRPQLETKI